MNDLKVFVNFRNGDGQQAAAHLYDALVDRYEPEQIFRSSETIPAGDDYIKALTAAPATSETTLSLIGPRWLLAEDSRGRPRLADPDDWVRREIRTALEAGRRVIPVLLDDARPLNGDELPDDIAALARNQYLRWYSRDTSGSFRTIAERLESLVPGLRKSPAAQESGVAQYNSPSNGGIVMAPMFGDNKTNWPPRTEK
ncbi:toll/interleukin-1 receptor domain-containing protein [Glycomyces sp. L485]|uniref:toll/interleukin-1 receptor domain-containing protein n=1 Tax=Glycomyces sp. L485 TaxID=2909235 RepID=UPI001F4B0EAC|nr:toll/interleukin-1 receptor domain-containing protein [Glycomyces sp. L485]MCH7231052.1 toll/interleukin-1 receptor domain-containing protein [Glycomyces sp. L485]